MNLLDLAVKINVEDDATSKIGKIASGIKKTVGAAAKAGAAVGVAAGGAVASVGKAALDAYADYEQLVGGVDKLFGDEAAAQVKKNADEAFRSAGMSANDYMETVTGFSAALISSLNGDTVEAATLSDKAIRDMSDNANTFGTDMESIQMAYQGFAKGNYTMLDNLKLGYGGTQEEMVRLINDSGVLNETISSMDGIGFDTVIEAIHAVQEQTNIAGTTAKEASGTISGSAETMKSAWTNLVTEMGKGDADIQGKVDLLVEAVGDYVTNIADRIPVIVENIMTAIPALIEGVLPILQEKGSELIGQLLLGAATKRLELAALFSGLVADVAAWIGENWESVVAKGAEAIGAIIEGITSTAGSLVTMLGEMIPSIATWIGDNWEGIVAKGSEIINSIISGISETVGGLMEIVMTIIPSVITWIGDNWSEITAKGSEIINSIITGITDTIGGLSEMVMNLIPSVISWIGDNWSEITAKGAEIINSIITGITDTVGGLSDFAMNIIPSVVSWIGDNFVDIVGKGASIIDSFVQGATDTNDTVLGPMFEGLPGQLGEKLGDLTTTLFTNGLNFIQGFYDGVTSLLSGDLGNTFINLASDLGALIGDVAGALVGAGFDFLYGFFTGSTNAANDSGQPFFTSLLDTLLSWIKAVGSVATFLTETGISFLNGFLNGVTGGKWTEVTDFFTAIPDKAKEFIGDVKKSLEQKGKDFIDGLKGGIDTVWENAKSFFSGLGDTIVGLIPNPLEILSDVGENLIQGFINGMNTFDLGGIIDTIFGPLAPQVKGILGIQSPSTVFYEIGDYLMQGLGNGIDDGEGPVDSLLGGIADGLPDNFADAYWAMHDMGAGLSTSFGTGLSNKFWDYVIPMVQGMANSIAGSIGGYYTLWYAGQNIMAGLGDSMVSYFYGVVASQLRMITAMIPAFKGPLDKDKNLLYENGEAIMGGLMRGIGEGADELYGMLGDITDSITTSAVSNDTAYGVANSGVTVIMDGAFNGASMSFRNRADMQEFSEILAEQVAETTMGRFAVA